MAKEIPPIASWPANKSVPQEKRGKKGGRYPQGTRKRPLRRKEAVHGA